MITLIEALGYRSLRYVRQPLGPFHVLVGPNASGKTTFLDAIAFLGHLMSDGVEAAVTERTANFYDLLWQRAGERFELAIEARIPEALRSQESFDTVRYEVAIRIDPDGQELRLQDERLFLKVGGLPGSLQRRLFPQPPSVPSGIVGTEQEGRTIIGKSLLKPEILSESDPETHYLPAGWDPYLTFLFAERFPVGAWLRELLTTGVQQLVLNSMLLRKASPPGQGRGFKPDGSNLPWVIADLQKKSPERVQQWIAHLQTALPDIEDIRTIERPEDRHRYLMIRYQGGIEVPSWMVSDGTLRMLALTLPAYLQDFQGIYLIEEPENGIHPRAIETVFQSLSSVYDAQVLVATHSPVILNIVDPEQVLCFAKTPEGATDIVRGSEHPALVEWRKETNLGVLFAAGVLG